jgi:ABC-type Zn uptake system ZnuABC Zn-binding protein ZnuA
MTQELIDGALSTQSSVSYNGQDVEVKQVGVDGIQEEKDLHKQAIKMAISELTGEPIPAETVKNTTKAAHVQTAPATAKNATQAAGSLS